jgi:hypothetical protein
VLRRQPYLAVVTGLAAYCAAALIVGCGRTTVTEVVAPDVVRCATAISADTASVPSDGGSVSISVSAARECAWTAEAQAPWVQLSSTTGQGDGTIHITVAPNPNPSTRSAQVVINNQQLNLTQEARPCRFELEPPSAQVGPNAARITIAVRTSDGCRWQASTPASWVRVPGNAQTGPGSVTVEVDSNNAEERETEIRIADQVFRLTQTEPGSAPTPNPSPTPPGPAPPPSGLPGPTNLTVRVLSDSSLTLSWTNADTSAQTEVYRNGSLLTTKDAGTSEHQETGLTRATNYTYVVRHVKSGITSPDSNSVVGRPVFFATGGNVSTSGGFRQHMFTGSGTFVVTQGGTIDEIIIIGGGGGGGGSEAGTEWGSGGGGAGGVRVITMKGESTGSYAVVVGSGGFGGRPTSSNPGNNNGGRGGSSSYGGTSAQGGGPGAGAGGNFLENPGGDGGSGGGGSGAPGGSGASGEGNGGGAGFVNRGGAAGGGGGGGRGGAGSAANGGQGGSGGPGFSTWAGTVARGGSGGRGNGGHGGSGSAPGDGGQGNDPGGTGGAGAAGAVLIRYRQ